MIQIREMQVRDTDAVAEIERQIFSQPWSRQGFLDAVNLGNTVFLVAEENNSIIGYILVCIWQWMREKLLMLQ